MARIRLDNREITAGTISINPATNTVTGSGVGFAWQSVSGVDEIDAVGHGATLMVFQGGAWREAQVVDLVDATTLSVRWKIPPSAAATGLAYSLTSYSAAAAAFDARLQNLQRVAGLGTSAAPFTQLAYENADRRFAVTLANDGAVDLRFGPSTTAWASLASKTLITAAGTFAWEASLASYVPLTGNVTLTGAVTIAGASAGGVALMPGDAIRPGYLDILVRSGGTLSSVGFVGYSFSTNTIEMYSVPGWSFNFTERPSIGGSPILSEANFLPPSAARFVNVSLSDGASFVTGSGGTWAYHVAYYVTSTGAHGGSHTGVVAGGTTVLAGVAGFVIRGFQWRVV